MKPLQRAFREERSNEEDEKRRGQVDVETKVGMQTTKNHNVTSFPLTSFQNVNQVPSEGFPLEETRDDFA